MQLWKSDFSSRCLWNEPSWLSESLISKVCISTFSIVLHSLDFAFLYSLNRPPPHYLTSSSHASRAGRQLTKWLNGASSSARTPLPSTPLDHHPLPPAPTPQYSLALLSNPHTPLPASQYPNIAFLSSDAHYSVEDNRLSTLGQYFICCSCVFFKSC